MFWVNSTGFLQTFQNVIESLEKENISYMIVGSLASMVYGEPRLTRDMDLVLDIRASDALKIEKLFCSPEYYCPPHEILTDEIRNRGQFNLLHISSGLKIDIIIKKMTPFDKSRFSRIVRIKLWENLTANVASAEDIIIKKLDFYKEGGSEKHLRDIRGIISNTEIDQSYLQKWIKEFRLEDAWAKVQ